MKFLILALAFACAQALPQQDAQILKQEFEISPEGSYNFVYETSNGIYGQGEGGLKKSAYSEYPSIEAKGSYSYISPEGENVQLTYTADENGFQPQGSHLPTPPPVPDSIARAIRYIEEHPPPPVRF